MRGGVECREREVAEQLRRGVLTPAAECGETERGIGRVGAHGGVRARERGAQSRAVIEPQVGREEPSVALDRQVVLRAHRVGERGMHGHGLRRADHPCTFGPAEPEPCDHACDHGVVEPATVAMPAEQESAHGIAPSVSRASSPAA